MITELHRAAARHALIPLNNDHEFYHKADVLKRTFPQSVLDAIKSEKAEADQYNKDADEAGGAILTPEAGSYWEEVQLLIKRGKAAQVRGDKKAEKEISMASERLLEAFDERVPDHDKPKFLQLDAQRHKETWDDRWSYIEFPAPLLNENLTSAHRISSTNNYAQRSVLAALGQPPISEMDAAKAREQSVNLRKKLLELRGEKTVQELKQNFRKHATKETKEAAVKARKEVREKMGMPKRKKKLKVVDGVFDVGRPERAAPEPDIEAGELKDRPREDGSEQV